MSRAVADFEMGERLISAENEAYLAPAPPRLGLEDGRTVVVHILDPLPVGDFALLRHRFEALHVVHSPHLSALLEVGYLPGEGGWYVTEDHGRITLADDHDLPTVLAAMVGACRGVQALHQAGLTHGGIAPSAIHPSDSRVTESGVTDSGVIDLPVVSLATVTEGRVLDISDPRLLDTVDPAVARGGQPSRASDLWSLGATLHLATTRSLLHPHLVTDQAIVALQRVMFEPVHLAEDLDPAVAAVVASCVARDPADRPPSAAALADHLETLVTSR